MQRAFREVCSEPGFAQFLEETLDRISAIESLGRTRELTIKDLWNSGKYKVTTMNKKGSIESSVHMEVVPGEQDDDDEQDD